MNFVGRRNREDGAVYGIKEGDRFLISWDKLPYKLGIISWAGR